MKFSVIVPVLAMLLGIIAIAMLPSCLLAWHDGQSEVFFAFLWPAVIAMAVGLLALFFRKRGSIKFSPGAGFFLVSSAWFLAGVLGALPFFLSGSLSNFSEAYFESVSGFTTTGSSVFASVEALPRALLFWRAMTHWLGGMGIVVLTVALLPLLGIGGFQLVKAETPGPEKDKVTPKITETAKILWIIYIGLTAAQIGLLMLGGMNWFDAVCHAFATMATGGFGTKNASVGHYRSVWIDAVCTIFMFLAGVNFSLYYRVLKGKIRDIFTNTEFKVYLAIFVIASIAISVSLLPVYGGFLKSFRFASFQSVSVLTTTGFATADFDAWPSFAKAVLLLLMFVGGCSGSTGGGIKVIRHVVLFKQAGNEMRRLLYPRGVFSVRLNGKIGRKDVVYGTAGFVILYLALLFITMLVIASSGSDLISSLSGALATLGNIGPGFGAIGPTMNYAAFPDYVTYVLSFAMVAGRLELWTVMVLFKRELWRR